MFSRISLRGHTASVLYGYQTAAAISAWTVTRTREQGKPVWKLVATVTQSSSFGLRQKPLIFSAPRQKGFWCWPIIEPPQLQRSTLTATLGPPEQ